MTNPTPYTEAQLLDDRALLRRLCAERVMGWKRDSQDKRFWVRPDRVRVPAQQLEGSWRPDESIAQVWELVEKLEADYEWSLESSTHQEPGYRFTLYGTGEDSGLIPPPGSAEATTALIAICLAALRAKGVIQ